MSIESNPYEFNSQAPILTEPQASHLTRRVLLPVGLVSYMATSVAGGVFGLIGGILGVVVGFFIALMTGVPVSIAMFAGFAILSRGPVRKWKVILLAAASGGLTGMLSCLWPLLFNPAGLIFGAFAAVLGSVSAAISAVLYLGLFTPREVGIRSFVAPQIPSHFNPTDPGWERPSSQP